MIETKILDKYLLVEGFRNVKVDNVNEIFNIVKDNSGRCHVQILDADFVAGFEHIYFAALNALKSFRLGLNISRNIAIEILLFASGQDQIKRAIEVLGIKPSTRNAVLVIVAEDRREAVLAFNAISKSLGWTADQSVIELTDEKMESIISAFGISSLEIEASMRGSLRDAVKNVLIERAALLVAQR